MDCKQCAEDMTAFMDGELSAADSEQMRLHLGACPACSEELSSLRETADFVESHNKTLKLHPGSWNLVRARILTESAPAPSRFWLPGRWRLAMGALVLFAALGFGYLQYQRNQDRNLDIYMSDYVKQRQAAPEIVLPPQEDPYGNNPFVDIKFTDSAINPFLPEGR